MRRTLPVALLGLAACTRPDAVGDLRSVVPERSEIYHQGVLFSSTDTDAERHDASIVDGTGRLRWRWEGEGEIARVRRDGDDTLLLVIDDTRETTGEIRRETLDGRILERIEAPDIHHDGLVLPDGRWAWLEHDERRARFDGRPGTPVATDRVMVAEPGGEPERRLSLFEDYPIAPWSACSHTRRGVKIPGYHQWTHSNSLVLSPDGTTLWVIARNLDALLAFDARTGQVLEQVGGRDATVPLPEGVALDHPHGSHMPDNARLLVFDNGLHQRRPSRAVELDLATSPPTVVWDFAHPDGETIGYLGDVRRLPGGNTLVVWSSDAWMTEVTPDGEVVWSMVLDDTKHIGRTELWSGPLP